MRHTINLTGAQTDTVLIMPPTGKRIMVHKLLNITVSAASDLAMFFGTNSNGNHIVFGDYAAKSGEAGVMNIEEAGEKDEALKITNTAGDVKGVITYSFMG